MSQKAVGEDQVFSVNTPSGSVHCKKQHTAVVSNSLCIDPTFPRYVIQNVEVQKTLQQTAI